MGRTNNEIERRLRAQVVQLVFSVQARPLEELVGVGGRCGSPGAEVVYEDACSEFVRQRLRGRRVERTVVEGTGRLVEAFRSDGRFLHEELPAPLRRSSVSCAFFSETQRKTYES